MKGKTEVFHSLARWSDQQFSHLPWRQNRSLYSTLVSEIMLQQTTVSVVKDRFSAFIKQFPDLRTLAECSEESLMLAWQGLGYYRRAGNLQAAAKFIIQNHQGKFPDDLKSLQKIPGIGLYTANAVRAIGFNKVSVALDSNLQRVLARFFNIRESYGTRLMKEIHQNLSVNNFDVLIDEISPRKFNESLMDLGRTICKSNQASCSDCPLQQGCQAKKNGTALELPVKDKKSAPKDKKHCAFCNKKLTKYQVEANFCSDCKVSYCDQHYPWSDWHMIPYSDTDERSVICPFGHKTTEYDDD